MPDAIPATGGARSVTSTGGSDWWQRATEAAVSLSLANLLFLRVAEHLEDPSREYFQKNIASASLIAFYFNILVVGVCAWGTLALMRHTKSRSLLKVGRTIFLLLALEALNSVRVVVHLTGFLPIWSEKSLLLLKAGALLALVFALVWLTERVWQILTAILLILVPLFPLDAFLTARSVLAPTMRAIPAGRPSPRPLQLDARLGRVVILVFDEMDQWLTFLNRPPGVDLPELERLRRESFYATAVHSPGDRTLISMPALITGRRVIAASPHRKDLMVTYEGATEDVPWGEQPNLFSQARQLGANTGLVGWYHPYCRILGGDLTTCTAVEGPYSDGSQLSDSLLEQYRLVDPTLTQLTHLGISRDRTHMVRVYRELHDKAIDLARDPRIQMALLHWPTPHPPGIYNRTDHQLTTTGPGDYFDNLVLADQTLGELRRAMESAGLWEQTTVILTSDHHFRAQLWPDLYGPLSRELQTAIAGEPRSLIPFLVKLAGQNHPATYDAPFNGILLHDLALALLQRKIKSPEDVVGWLDGNRSRITLKLKEHTE